MLYSIKDNRHLCVYGEEREKEKWLGGKEIA